jgi:hypothetical protein
LNLIDYGIFIPGNYNDCIVGGVRIRQKKHHFDSYLIFQVLRTHEDFVINSLIPILIVANPIYFP